MRPKEFLLHPDNADKTLPEILEAYHKSKVDADDIYTVLLYYGIDEPKASAIAESIESILKEWPTTKPIDYGLWIKIDYIKWVLQNPLKKQKKDIKESCILKIFV